MCRGRRLSRWVLDGDDGLSSGGAADQVSDGAGDVAERVGPVDDGLDLAGLDELAKDDQVGCVLRGDERAELLVDEGRQQKRPQRSVGATQPATIGFASDE